MKSTYKRVGDVLSMVRRFHNQLAEFYTRLYETSDKERVRMLLDYMSRHEKNFEQAIEEYNEQTSHKLLNTWIQYTPDRGVLSIPEVKDFEKDATLDDVIEIAMELDDRLVHFYSEAARLVDSYELKDLFNKLKEQEEEEKSEIKKNATSIKNYI
jgi:rubrerythrin